MPALGGVAKACDAAARPLRAEVLAPWRAALHHGEGAVGHVGFDADLIERVRRDALLAVVADRRDVGPWQHERGC